MQIPFATQFARGRSPVLNSEAVINLYPEVDPRGKNQVVLHRCPGLKPFADSGAANPVRGLFGYDASTGYAVIGATLYSVSTTGTLTSVGTLQTSSGRVSMSRNSNQLVIVDGFHGYTFDGSTLSEIADPDFLGSTTTDVLDGFSLFHDPGTGKFYASEINDATNIDALNFATAEGAPDAVLSLVVDHREIWLFGENTIEVWYNAGAANFPFARTTVIEYGIGASFALAKCDNTVFWLGNDGVVWRANGYQPQRVSTHAIEYVIAQEGMTDAFAFAYSDEGHKHVVFCVGSYTLVYDVATNWWHQRKNHNPADSTDTLWRANSYMVIGGKHIVGDRKSGKLFELSHDYFLDDGDEQRWEAVSPPAHTGNQQRAFWHQFELCLQTGVGLATGQGEDPQVFLSWTDDGGRTWSDALWRSIGVMGNYDERVEWRRLGHSEFHGRSFRVVGTDPVVTAILGAYAQVEAGDGG